MMDCRPGFDVIGAFRDLPVDGYTWGHLMDSNPKYRSALAKGLTRETPSRRKKKTEHHSFCVELVDSRDTCLAHPSYPRGNDRTRAGQARPESNQPIGNFYTTALVYEQPGSPGVEVDKTLIDSGSVLNIIPFRVAKRLNLNAYRMEPLTVKSATATTTVLDSFCRIHVAVAGVDSLCICYVLPKGIIPSYNLMLGRKWMFQVRAIGDYGQNTYLIRDGKNRSYRVFPDP